MWERLGGVDEEWEYKQAVCAIVSYMGHYNGYVRFESRPLVEEKYGGIGRYVPVHGGLTFARSDKFPFSDPDGDEGAFIYGFDTAHAGDDEPDSHTKDIEWVRAETQRMADAIMCAVEFEQDYLADESNESRNSVISNYEAALAARGIAFNQDSNFGLKIHMLGGQL